MKDMVIGLALKTLLPLLISFIVVPVVDFIKHRLIPAIDKAPPSVKAGVALIVSTIASALTAMSGITVPDNVSLWDATLVSSLLTWVASLALKQKKQLAKKDEALKSLGNQVANPFHIPEQQ